MSIVTKWRAQVAGKAKREPSGKFIPICGYRVERLLIASGAVIGR